VRTFGQLRGDSGLAEGIPPRHRLLRTGSEQLDHARAVLWEVLGQQRLGGGEGKTVSVEAITMTWRWWAGW
jgi:hypothetical protein